MVHTYIQVSENIHYIKHDTCIFPSLYVVNVTSCVEGGSKHREQGGTRCTHKLSHTVGSVLSRGEQTQEMAPGQIPETK